ncbi:MAG: hypothetical protein LVS60_01170 [Nodosilinea sp. LVE1205-7]|jgi:hypothetical protein
MAAAAERLCNQQPNMGTNLAASDLISNPNKMDLKPKILISRVFLYCFILIPDFEREA